MTPITPEQFERLLPLACAWAEEQERLILEKGVGLTALQMADAGRVGIASPERIRLMEIEQIPLPQHPRLLQAARETGLLPPDTAGLTLRYGIYIRSPFRGVREFVVHELVHVRQYELFEGFEPFLRRYLWECVTRGYPHAPMEQEALSVALPASGSRRPYFYNGERERHPPSIKISECVTFPASGSRRPYFYIGERERHPAFLRRLKI